jgi:hypothetical protein
MSSLQVTKNLRGSQFRLSDILRSNFSILRLPVVRLQCHVDTFNIFGSIGPRISNETPAALLPHKLFLGVLGSTCLLHVKYA